jgi:uncharacterized protein
VKASVEAFFLPAGSGRSGQRFCVFHRPPGVARAAVVHVHAFAEEMNKSRRMAALQARAMAQAGYAVLQIDLLGCGDSDGAFEDAGWDDWLADVREAASWLRARCPAPLWLWGHRVGALIAVQAAALIDVPCDFVFWQPAIAGKQMLQQFLRLKVAGDLLDGNAKGVMSGLRQQLAGGKAVDVAGYRLAPGLAEGLERAQLVPPRRTGRLEWLELSSRADAGRSPASAKSIEQWQRAGFRVRDQQVSGPAFWQTAEIEEAPALIDATLAALAQRETAAA